MGAENIVYVYRPELTAEERDRRMKRIADAAERLLRATAIAKKERKRV